MVCLFNTVSNKAIAYCRYHKCGITEKQIECKNCCEKQCYYLVKYEDKNYWRKKNAKKQQRKAKKQAMNDYLNKVMGG